MPQQAYPASGQTYVVTSCADDGSPGTLRKIFQSSAHDGDSVDLTQLACSNITLESGTLSPPNGHISLIGPDDRTIVVSGNNHYRVFDHGSTNLNTLYIRSLTIADGYVSGSGGGTYAGCISTAGSILLIHSKVTHCTVHNEFSGVAYGGAINAGDVFLISSIVSGSLASAQDGDATGGGVRATEMLKIKYSSIEGNHAVSAAGGKAFGGAITTGSGSIYVYNSTVSYNSAGIGAGIRSYGDIVLQESTISHNYADTSPAIESSGMSLTIGNSTVAFNHATLDAGYGAVRLKGAGTNTLTMESTILGMNTRGPANLEADLYVQGASLKGSDNIILAINQAPPAGFVTSMEDPLLGPLKLNGGITPTHALLAGSPAIGVGNAQMGDAYDQRGPGYPRTTGVLGKVDVGSFQSDSIFAGAFECALLPAFLSCQ